MNKLQQVSYLLRDYSLKSICKGLVSISISDVVVISFRKTGKTWLRLLYAKALQEEYGLKKIRLDTQFMTLGRNIPNVMFSHAGTANKNNKINFQNSFKNKKIIFLARDPRAVLTSRYHDYVKRTKEYSGTMHQFVKDEKYGINKIIDDFNSWASFIREKEVLLISYENLINDTKKEFKHFLSFIGVEISEESIQKAIEYNKPSNMKRLEKENAFEDPRMQAGDIDDQNSFKVRKAKVDSFKEELNKDDLDYVTNMVGERLDPLFGYNTNNDSKLPIINPSNELNTAINAILKAGSKILEIYSSNFEVKFKGKDNPLTEADLKSNEILIKELSKTGHHILSEEMKDNLSRLEKEKTWIIDPLDGTSDFVNKTGEFTIMVALVSSHVPVLGVVYWPTENVLFIAEKDKGAFKLENGSWSRLKCSRESSLSNSKALGSRNHLSEKEKEIFKNLGIAKFSPRGSSLKAMDISSGKAEIYFTLTDKIKQWDTAASYCILKESGGNVTDILGNDIKYNTKSLNHENGILITNNIIHQKIVEKLRTLI